MTANYNNTPLSSTTPSHLTMKLPPPLLIILLPQKM